MTELLSWQVGDVSIVRVEESITPVPSEYLLPGCTAELVAAQRPWIDPYFTEDGSAMQLSVHSFVVVDGDTTIVVDTCAGMHEGRPLMGDAGFIDRLAGTVDGGLAGVDVVVCTHLHFDHIGWNTVQNDAGEWVPAFPNARYLVSTPEWDAFDEPELAPTSLSPVEDAGLLQTVALDHQVSAHVRLVPTTGHTAGHVSVGISSNGDEALITGDAFHSPIQLAHPEVAAWRVDHDSEASTATRQRLIDELANTPTLVLGTHFAPPTAGEIRHTDDGVQFAPR